MDENPRTTLNNTDPTVFSPSSDEGPVATGERSASGAAGDTGSAKTDKPYQSAGGFTAALVGLLIAAAIIIFLAQNTRSVVLSFLSFNGQASLAVIVLVVAFGAVVVDQLVSFIFRFRHRQAKNNKAALKQMRTNKH